MAAQFTKNVETSVEKMRNPSLLGVSVTTNDAPEPIVPKSPNFYDFDPLEVARQICLYEHGLYCNIEYEEMLDTKWIKNPDLAPNVIRVQNYYKDLIRWTSSLIVNCEKLDRRAKIIKKLMAVAILLFQCSNFNSAQGIMIGLGSSAILRLKTTWNVVKKKFWQNT